ncbi:uncharacterized protein LODBEIA_P50520 [Lodderomyces beijingensis]|uniref:Asparaginase n=1 Tax=Lodderomyces beijingensis TaxID=1775926 RepID=A0ABP0ZRP5_9ASCO
MKDLLVIHIGAGNHHASSNSKYAKLIKKALSKHTIAESSRVLEDSPWTNTGYGSSLNRLGQVEIDASFISHGGDDGTTRMGSLTGLKCRNPTVEMFRIYDEIAKEYQTTPELNVPLALNCTSLKSFVGIREDDSEGLVSEKSYRIFQLYKNGVSSVARDKEEGEGVMDTIGLAHITHVGVDIATSSGGNFFKLPGRMGCAAIPGAAIAFLQNESGLFCCMCSGDGEQIVKYHLASTIIEKYTLYEKANNDDDNDNDDDDDDDESQRQHFCEYVKSELTRLDPNFYFGFILIVARRGGMDEEATRNLIYGHSTKSFHFGFRVGDQTKAILSFAEKEADFTFGEYRLSLA